MVSIPRPFLRVALCALALFLASCSPSRPRIVRVAISEHSCTIGCRAFSTSFSKDASSASPAFEFSTSGENNRPLLSRAFAGVPFDALEHCVQPSPLPQANFVLVGVHLTDGTNRFCTVSSSDDGNSQAREVRAYARSFGWPVYRSTLAAQYRAIEQALASGTIRAVLLHVVDLRARNALTVRFDRNGTATFSCGNHAKATLLTARISFEAVTRALRDAPAQSLIPGYPPGTARAHGVVVTILLPHNRFALRAPDSTTWEPPMRRLVNRLEDVAREAASGRDRFTAGRLTCRVPGRMR